MSGTGVPLKAPHPSQNAPHIAYFFFKNALQPDIYIRATLDINFRATPDNNFWFAI
jgi:hypothetical protein